MYWWALLQHFYGVNEKRNKSSTAKMTDYVSENLLYSLPFTLPNVIIVANIFSAIKLGGKTVCQRKC
jgi:hypothetical protein